MRINLSIAMAMALLSILVISGCATPSGSEVEEQTPDITKLTEANPEVGPEIGNLAPDFTLRTIDGQSITLSDFRGKMVMLVFWVKECKECIRELPHIQAIFNEKISDSFIVLTVNVDNDVSEVQEFVDTNKYTFPVLLDLDGEACIDYRRGAPTTFFVDANGIIREIRDETFESLDEIKNILQSLGIDQA